MKVVEYLVSKETINTSRINVSLPDQYSDGYSATKSLQPSRGNSACTTWTCPDPWYKILFPYDAVYSSEIIIGFKKGHRFPQNVTIYGTKDLFHFDVLIPSLIKKFCDEDQEYGYDCATYQTHHIPISFSQYRGFLIQMNGYDSTGTTTQLCIGSFEVVGKFIRIGQTCQQYHPLTFFLLSPKFHIISLLSI